VFNDAFTKVLNDGVTRSIQQIFFEAPCCSPLSKTARCHYKLSQPFIRALLDSRATAGRRRICVV